VLVVLYLRTGAKHEELLPETILPTSGGVVKVSCGCWGVAHSPRPFLLPKEPTPKCNSTTTNPQPQ
jgi:hypothetical protein